MKLKDEPYMPIAELGDPFIVVQKNILVIVEDVTSCRTIERSEDMEQRALACARCANNCNNLTLLNLHVNAAQDLKGAILTVPGRVDLSYVFNSDHLIPIEWLQQAKGGMLFSRDTAPQACSV